MRSSPFDRRRVLEAICIAMSAPAWSFGTPQNADPPESAPPNPALTPAFPTQPPELVRETVLVSHFDLKRLQQLVEARPSLARAAWDWGFGDWESALGAASHMGNRPIAEYLISKGARPSLFSAAMFGHIDVVKAFVTTQPGVQRIRGPHSISLLAHAKAGGDAARPVYDYLASLGDADADPPAPLTKSDLDAVVGVYPFGPADNDRINVTAGKAGINWTRAGSTARPLFHLGDRAFYPAGAVAVRIRFTLDSGETRMTISDPDLVFSALRRTDPAPNGQRGTSHSLPGKPTGW
jgi:hypothetical protein